MARPPSVLLVGGVDPSGAAGVGLDLRVAGGLGVHPAFLPTALTVQSTIRAGEVRPVAPRLLGAMVRAVTRDLTVRAVKVGMLAGILQARAVGVSLPPGRPVVLDPVLRAHDGTRLTDPRAVLLFLRLKRLKRWLLVLTPNRPEGEELLRAAGFGGVSPPAEPEGRGRALLDLGADAVVLKGGHGSGPLVEDLLCTPKGVQAFRRPRLREARGTGCAFSTSLACFLALGYPLGEAVRRAGDYVWRALDKGYVPGGGRRVLGVEAVRALG